MERWDGKSGHGAESVRHAEMSLAATGDRSGPVRTCQDMSEPVSWLVVGLVPGSCGEIATVLHSTHTHTTVS